LPIGVGHRGIFELPMRGGGLDQEDHKREADSEIEGEDQAMAAASQEGADAELQNSRLEGRTESRKADAGARGGENIGFFDDLAKRAVIRKRVDHRGGYECDCQRDPGAACEHCQGGRSAELLEEAQKPIRRRPSEEAITAGCHQRSTRGDQRLQTIGADDNAKRSELQAGRNAQKEAPRQELGGEALQGKDRAKDERTAGEHDEPPRAEEAQRVHPAAAGGNRDRGQRLGGTAGEAVLDVQRCQIGEGGQRDGLIDQHRDGITLPGIEEHAAGVSGDGAVMPVRSRGFVVDPGQGDAGAGNDFGAQLVREANGGGRGSKLGVEIHQQVGDGGVDAAGGRQGVELPCDARFVADAIRRDETLLLFGR